jgi:hypothetical protein
MRTRVRCSTFAGLISVARCSWRLLTAKRHERSVEVLQEGLSSPLLVSAFVQVHSAAVPNWYLNDLLCGSCRDRSRGMPMRRLECNWNRYQTKNCLVGIVTCSLVPTASEWSRVTFQNGHHGFFTNPYTPFMVSFHIFRIYLTCVLACLSINIQISSRFV